MKPLGLASELPPVSLHGGSRPNRRFQQLCDLAGVKPKTNVETGEDEPWLLKDLRKTCATYYDAHVPESSIEILGHSVGGVSYSLLRAGRYDEAEHVLRRAVELAPRDYELAQGNLEYLRIVQSEDR